MKRKSKPTIDLLAFLRPDDDPAGFAAHADSYERSFRPLSEREAELVARLTDLDWQIGRILMAETAFYTWGHSLYESRYAEQDPEMRRHLAIGHTLVTHSRELNRLHRHEHKIHREREQVYAQLKQLRGGIPDYHPDLALRDPQGQPEPHQQRQREPETKVLATYLPNDFAYSDRR